LKTKTITEEIPSKKVERTMYMCSVDGCNFESFRKEAVSIHFTSEHVCHHEVPDDNDDGGIGFFESESSLKDFGTTKLRADYSKVFWSGPGWYYFYTTTRPCARHCCTDNVAMFCDLDKFYADRKEMVQNLMNQIRVVEDITKREQTK
jgi:hypothetical protein